MENSVVNFQEALQKRWHKFHWVSFFYFTSTSTSERPVGYNRQISLLNHETVWVPISTAIGYFLEEIPFFSFFFPIKPTISDHEQLQRYSGNMKRKPSFGFSLLFVLVVVARSIAMCIFSIAMMMQALYQSSFSVWLGE